MKGGNEMNKNAKKYEVTIYQTWSETLNVEAINATEAKKLAWNKWKAKKANYGMLVHRKE